jgi:hypothetical protein
MRHILLDLANADKNELFGKDLALTNAPDSILKEISKSIKTSSYVGLPAEEVFIKEVKAKGYEISLLNSLDELDSYIVDAQDY